MRGPLTRDRDEEEADRAAHRVIRCATHQEGPVSGDLLPGSVEHGWVDDRSGGSKQTLISGVLAPVSDRESLARAERQHGPTIWTRELRLRALFLDGPRPRVGECVSAEEVCVNQGSSLRRQWRRLRGRN